jgi:hypothetical protein
MEILGVVVDITDEIDKKIVTSYSNQDVCNIFSYDCSTENADLAA